MTDIQVKVATVISPSQVAFNMGSDSGIEKGSRAMLYRTVEVRDPETDDVLGTVQVPKISFRIDLVEPKFCVGTVADAVGSAPGVARSWILSGTLTRTKTITLQRSVDNDVVHIEIGEFATITQRE